jgi:hypothetical protein
MSFGLIINSEYWLCAREVQMMRFDEREAYHRLIHFAWQGLMVDQIGLPDDDKLLAQLAGVGIRAWRNRFAPKIRAIFRAGADGTLYADWIMREYERFKQRDADYQERKDSGRHAAHTRWGSRRKPVGSSGNGMQSVRAIAVNAGIAPDFRAKPGAIGETNTRTYAEAMRTHAKSVPSAMPTQCASIEIDAENDAPPIQTINEQQIQNSSKSSESSSADADASPRFPTNARMHAEGHGEPDTDAQSEASGEVKWKVGQWSGDDVRNVAKLMHTAASNAPAGAKEPDLKIAAQVLQAAGSVGGVIEMLNSVRDRASGAAHIKTYGYFLTLARERGRR